MTGPELDISGARKIANWSRRERAGRVVWGAASLLFAIIPRPLHSVRCALLRAFGAKIGSEVHIYPSVRITIPWNLEIGDQTAIGDGVKLYALGKISIGKRVTISQWSHICAGSHDWRSPEMLLTKPAIFIGDEAWICADAFIGPGVVVGKRTIVGARGVVMQDIPEGTIFAGNPARQIGLRD